MTFKSVGKINVPTGRKGKHNRIVTAILADLKHLKGGDALKVPLKELGDTKQNVRSALSRASKKNGHPVSTGADQDYLYVWNGGR